MTFSFSRRLAVAVSIGWALSMLPAFAATISPVNSMVTVNDVQSATLVGDGSASVTVHVVVRDQNGAPLPQRSVNLSSSIAGGSILPYSVVTDATGSATFQFRSTQGGTTILTATADGVLLNATVSVKVTPVFSSSRSSLSSSKTQETADASHPVILSATVRDMAGNTMMGKTVTFRSTSSNAYFSSTVATTNAYGIATVNTWRLQPDVSSFIASVDGMDIAQTTVVSFVSSSPLFSPTLSTIDPASTPSWTVGNTVTMPVTIRDTNGSPMSSQVAVYRIVPPNGQAFYYSGTTDANGHTSVSYTPNVIGTYAYTVAVGGVNIAANYSFTIYDYVSNFSSAYSSVTFPGSYGSMAPADGSTVIIARVIVRDTNNKPMSGRRIHLWTSGGTNSPADQTTDANGQADFSLVGTQEGSYYVYANVDNANSILNIPMITWTRATNTNPSSRFTMVTSDRQTYTLGDVMHYSAYVADDSNRGLSRYTTLVLVRPDGSTWSTQAFTDGSGRATFDITPSSAGYWDAYLMIGGVRIGNTYKVYVQSAYQNNSVSPSNSSVSWTHGTLIADGTYNFAVNVTARDSANRGVMGKNVYVNFPSLGVSMLPSSINTDVNGFASYQIRFPSAGTYYMTVSVDGTTIVSSVPITVSGTNDYSYGNGYTQNCVSAPGNLVKLPDDGNVYTQMDSTVYYYGRDCMRHSFPNADVYFSWYPNFDGVQIVNADVLASMPLGKNVTYRPGKSFVKMRNDARVYYVTRGGVLRWIPSESYASNQFGGYFGNAWATRVHDLPDAFVTNYQFGNALDYNLNINDEINKAPTIDDNF